MQVEVCLCGYTDPGSTPGISTAYAPESPPWRLRGFPFALSRWRAGRVSPVFMWVPTPSPGTGWLRFPSPPQWTAQAIWQLYGGAACEGLRWRSGQRPHGFDAPRPRPERDRSTDQSAVTRGGRAMRQIMSGAERATTGTGAIPTPPSATRCRGTVV